MIRLRILAALSAVALLLPGLAMAESQPNKPSDPTLDCTGILAESAKADAALGEAESLIAGARATEIGVGVATNAAVYSGLLGSVPGLGALSGVVGSAVSQAQESSEEAKQEARLRRYYLLGLYQGKGCDLVGRTAPAE